jgi:hypothetical protein
MRNANVVEPLVIVTSEKGRDALLAWAERALPAGEALVVVKDLVGAHRGMRTSPASRRARLIATEAPTVLRGGLTALISYYVVPTDELDAKETHLEDGEVSHAYDTMLRVARFGRREMPPAVAA